MKNLPPLSAALLMLLLPTTANAQLTLDVTKVTCRQYLTGSVMPRKSMTLWLSGYYHGKREATTSTTRPLNRHQDEMVTKAIETVFGLK